MGRYMESMSKKIDQGIPPWPKKSLDESPFANSNGAGASSSGTETGFQPSDAGIIKLSTVGDGGIKKTQNPSPISDKITRSSIGGHVTSRAGGGNSVNDVQIRSGRNLDHAMDPKKLRRIISNRVSAQKSRMKKLQYVTEMERRVKALQAQIAALAPQVALYKDHQLSLKLEQKRLNERMAALAKNEKLRDAEIEEKKAEVNRLRNFHLNLQHQKIKEEHDWQNGFEQMPNPNWIQYGTGQMVYMNSNQGAGQMPIPSMKPTVPEQKVKVNSNLGGIEQILNYNPVNQIHHNCFI